MKSICIFLLIILAALAASGCGSDGPENSNGTPDLVNIPFRQDGTLSFLRNGQEIVSIDIEIAETDSARRRGLMQRQSLPDTSGMLFIFDREEPQGFWMGNTPLALDLMFVSADSQIVDIDKYNRPNDPSTIASDAPARFVVEVPAGFADTYGISETDRVAWDRGGNGRVVER